MTLICRRCRHCGRRHVGGLVVASEKTRAEVVVGMVNSLSPAQRYLWAEDMIAVVTIPRNRGWGLFD